MVPTGPSLNLEWQTTLRCREGCICLRTYVPHDLDRWPESAAITHHHSSSLLYRHHSFIPNASQHCINSATSGAHLGRSLFQRGWPPLSTRETASSVDQAHPHSPCTARVSPFADTSLSFLPPHSLDLTRPWVHPNLNPVEAKNHPRTLLDASVCVVVYLASSDVMKLTELSASAPTRIRVLQPDQDPREGA